MSKKNIMVVLALMCMALVSSCQNVPIPLSLSVDASDAKTEYVEGGTLDVSGLKAVLRMSDGTDKPVGAERLTYSGYDLEVSGVQLVTVTYGGLSDRYRISVSKAPTTIVGLVVQTPPDKVSYSGADDRLDLDGLTITTYMSDGTSRLVEWSMQDAHGIGSEPANGTPVSTSGDVTVTYQGRKAKFNITYTKQRTLDSVGVLTKPEVTNYGTGGRFSAKGLVLCATYSDGGENIVRYDGDNMSFSVGELSLSEGAEVTKDMTVTVSYPAGGPETCSTMFDITYQAPARVDSVSIVDKYLYSATYTAAADAPSYEVPGGASMRLDVKYTDGKVVTVGRSSFTIDSSAVDLRQANATPYKVRAVYHDEQYGVDVEDWYEVRVVELPASEERTLGKVTIMDRSAYEGTYVVGGYRLPEGEMELMLTYDDGTVSFVTAGREMFLDYDEKWFVTPSTEPYTIKVSYSDGKSTVETSYRIRIVDRLVATAISVSSESKATLEFNEGDTFEYGGLVLDVRYPDASIDQVVKKIVDEDDGSVAVSASDGHVTIGKGDKFPSGGDWTVTVRYTPDLRDPISVSRTLAAPVELTCGYTIKVIAPVTVESISIASSPDMMSYTGNEAKLDLTGLTVTAYMSDGTSRLVEWNAQDAHGITTVPANGTLVSMSQDVTVSYQAKSTKFPVTYTTERTLQSVEVLTEPKVTNYGKGGLFSAEGLSVVAKYDDRSENIVRFGASGLTVSLTQDAVVTEDQTVTVTYTDGGVKATATFQIKFQASKKVSGIAIVNKSQYEKTVTVNGSYSKPGTVPVTVYYDDGTSDVKEGTVGAVGVTTVGDKTVTVSYTDPEYSGNVKTDTYTVHVVAATTVDSISIASNPDKVSYTAGGVLDLTGLQVTAYMSDGTTRLVAWTSSNANGITTSPANKASVTKDQDVTVTYGGKSAKFPVTYTAARTLVSVDVMRDPDKTNYAKDEKFSAEGLSLLATYSDRTQNVVRYASNNMTFKVNGTTWTPGSTVVAAAVTVTVSYMDGSVTKTATFPIQYQAPKKVTDIEIVNKALYGTTLVRGASYDRPTSVSVTVRYDDGTGEVKELPVDDRTDVDIVGPHVTTVSYTDPNYDDNIQSDSYTVTVVLPTIKAAGIEVEVFYESGSSGVTRLNEPASLDDLTYRVTFLSDVPEATYTYQVSGGTPVSVSGNGWGDAVAYIPATDSERTVSLTKVEKDGYEPYVPVTEMSRGLAKASAVSLSVDKGDPYDWKLVVDGGGADHYEYRYIGDDVWKPYTESFPIFGGAGDDVSVVTVQARGYDAAGNPVTDTYEAKYGRVPSTGVTWTYGYMDGVNGDIPEDGAEADIKASRYPTVKATVSEGLAVRVRFSGDLSGRWYGNPAIGGEAKLAVTSETETKVSCEVYDPSGERMGRDGGESGPMRFVRASGGYALGSTGPMGGTVVYQDTDTLYETVVPPRLKVSGQYLLSCEQRRTLLYHYADAEALSLMSHSCEPGGRCQLWTLAHPFGDDEGETPLNLWAEMSLVSPTTDVEGLRGIGERLGLEKKDQWLKKLDICVPGSDGIRLGLDQINVDVYGDYEGGGGSSIMKYEWSSALLDRKYSINDLENMYLLIPYRAFPAL